MDKMEISPPPLSPQAPTKVATPPASPSPSPQPLAQPPPASIPPPASNKLGKSSSSSTATVSPSQDKSRKSLDKSSSNHSPSKVSKQKKSLELDHSKLNGSHEASDSDEDDKAGRSKKVEANSDDKTGKKRRKSDKKSSVKSKELVNTTESEESDHEKDSPPAKISANGQEKSPKSALENIPSDMRFEPKQGPKGLVDALSNFFTPGLKRTSRTAMNSLIKPDPKPDQEVKRVRLSVEEKEESGKKDDSKVEERKRHASSGQQQVKSLYDGLSHLYNDCDSRLRSAPKDQKDAKDQPEKGRSDKSSDEKAPEASKSSDEKSKSKSPSRVSDSEKNDKDEEKSQDVKTEDEDKSKGSSKTPLILGMLCSFVVDNTPACLNTVVCFSLTHLLSGVLNFLLSKGFV